ncbi:MAG: TolC family protein, partial [Methylococcaceae bacterium]|nr:TolC family protein [Methylococcaceae bacterium]
PTRLQTRLAPVAPLPEALPKIPGLLPSQLLLQRPDLRLAQTEVRAMAASLGAAKAELFPKVVLSASGGFGALAVGGFPSLAETVYTLGSGLTAPLFNAGRIRAQITAADARLDQAAANYEKTFLIALEDVENAYVAHASALENRDRLAQAETAAEQSHTYAEAFYQRGATDFLSVLDAQRTKLSASDELIRAEAAVRISLVSLYRAFGGGWTEMPAVEPGNDEAIRGGGGKP